MLGSQAFPPEASGSRGLPHRGLSFYELRGPSTCPGLDVSPSADRCLQGAFLDVHRAGGLLCSQRDVRYPLWQLICLERCLGVALPHQ